MSLVWLIVGARLRNRRRSLLLLAVLAGVGLGLSAGAVAIGRRTDSAYRRIADRTEATHFEFAGSGSPEDMQEALAANPENRLGDVRHWVGFVDVFRPFPVSPDYLAPWHSATQLEVPTVLNGRLALAENEIVLSEPLAEVSSYGVGDEVALGLMTSDFADVVPFEFVITGVVTLPAEWGMVDDTSNTPTVLLSRSFAEGHPEVRAWFSSGARLPTPPTRAEASALLTEFDPSLTLEGVSLEKEAAARAALRPLVTSLYVLGGLGLLATTSVVGFALSRERARWDNERRVLKALGSSGRRIDMIHLVTILSMVLAVGFIALLVVSQVGAVGGLRRFDDPPGVGPDWIAVVLLVTGALVAGGLSTLITSPRAEQYGRLHRGRGLVGIGLPIGSTATSWRAVGVTMVLGIVGFAGAAATVPYLTSLNALVEEPGRYGQEWEVMARNRWGDQSPDAIARLADDPAVDAAATLTTGSLLVNDWLTTRAASYVTISGPDLMTITQGRAATRPDEAVIGAATRSQLGIELGDELQIQGRSANSTGGGEVTDVRRSVTVVGEALFPTLSQPGSAPPRLDEGLVVTSSVWSELYSDQDAPEVTLLSTATIAEGHDLAARTGTIEDLGFGENTTEWFVGARPAEIRSAAEARPWTAAGLVLLTLLVTGVLVHAQRTVLRNQRRDLAVLRALGATRKQVRRVAWQQGLALLVPLVVVGVPVGFGIGRLLFARLAQSIGVVSDPVTPWWTVGSFVGAAGFVVAVGIFVGSRSVDRVSPALSLREP